ncbi:hypothetical protein ACHHYP_14267 [Achlya hypogyna]|uniref:EF-hand domain-containing protein n=1 Tax=Achlya hypogyna TaxID=1202772 RepID=A0A1V9YDM0_ACHHY|nr:hypothetical protein ACHHYP_14267 [Achlya hypogyna]
MQALVDARVACLDALESVKALIRKSEGEPEGYMAAYFLQDQDDDDDALNTSILFRRPGRLSDLGIDKCTRLFHAFDTDHNGTMSYEEFIDYLTSLNRSTPLKKDPLRHVVGSMESWQMYMSDAYITNAQGDLTLEGFLMYREATEHLYPLADDLTRFGIPWICDGLVRHMALQKVFAAYDAPSSGKVAVALLPYLLAEAGYTVSSPLIGEVVRQQAAHFQCMDTILQRNRAIRLFGYKQKSRVVASDMGFVYRDAFLALALSRYAPPMLPMWSRFLVALKQRSFMALRTMHATAATLRTYLQRATATGLLQLARLLPTTYGDHTIKVDVGNPEFATAAEIQVTFTTEVDSSATLHKLGYRHDGAECFVYIDFLARNDISDEEMTATVAAMESLVKGVCTDHFASMPYYHSYLVVSPPRLETHGSPVVRIVVLFTDVLDPFNVFVDCGLPSMLQVHNLVASFDFSLFLNVSLHDVLSNKKFNCLQHLGLRAFASARIGRQPQVLKQSQYDADAAMFQDEYLRKEKLAHTKASRRRNKTGATTWRQQCTTTHHARLQHVWALASYVTSLLAFSKSSSWSWSFPSLAQLFGAPSVLDKLLSPGTFATWSTGLGTTGRLFQLWKDAVAAFENELYNMKAMTTSDAARSGTYVEAAAASQVFCANYSVLVANLCGINAMQAQAGAMGVDVLIEGLDIIPLLPKLAVPVNLPKQS